MLKVWKTREAFYIGNTIVYDVKSYQVKTTILKCTNVRIKGLKFNWSYKRCWYGEQVCDAIRQT